MKKLFKIRPWRVSFFKRQNDFDEGNYERFCDLSLTRNSRTDNVREYQINNDKEELVLEANCQLSSGILEIIELYYPKTYDKSVLKIQKKISEYVVLKEEIAIGKIQIEETRLCFSNVDNEVLYSATLVSADKGYQPLELKAISDYFYNIELHFSLNGKDNKNWGKYYFALHNLDLTCDKKILFDRYIAIALAIMIEEVIVTLIKPIKPTIGRGISTYS
jgi:hypothetical protein